MNCLIVGDGSLFAIRIDDSSVVDFLKEAIAKKKMYDFPADLMKVYSAQREGTWFLSSDGESGRKLRNGEIPDEIEHFLRGNEEMDPTCGLFDLFDERTPKYKVIHVLVQLPATGWKRHKIEEQDVTETYADHLQAVDVQALNNPRKVEAFISSR